MKTRITLIIILSLAVTFGCGSSQNSNGEYVFDDLGEYEKKRNTSPADSKISDEYITVNKFIIQIGLFKELNEAEEFIKFNQEKVNFILKWEYDLSRNQYTVRSPLYNSRIKAEEIYGQIKKQPEFSNSSLIIKRVKVKNPYNN